MQRWWDCPTNYLLAGFPGNVVKAESRLRRAGLDATPEQIVASLSLDTWRFLLTPCLEATVWKALTAMCNGDAPHYPGRSRRDFEQNVELIRHLHNRASHQEPLISASADQHVEIPGPACYVTADDTVARNITPDAADWIAARSRVLDVIAQCPRHKISRPHSSWTDVPEVVLPLRMAWSMGTALMTCLRWGCCSDRRQS